MSAVDQKTLIIEPYWGPAFRTAGNGLATIVKNVLWAGGLPAVALYKMGRHYTVIDVASVVTIRKLNRVYASWTGSPLCQEVTTAAQDNHTREEGRLKGELGRHSVHPQFSTVTSRYIHAFIHRLLLEMANAPPTKAERSFTQRMLGNIPLARIVDDAALKSAINLEAVLLHFCSKLNPLTQADCTIQLVETAIQSLGFSLGQQKQLELHLKQRYTRNTEAEKFIASIKWHEDNKSLPPGIPRSAGLTPDNLRGRLDSELKMYLDKRAEQLLAYLVPESLTTGTAGFYYQRWGRDQLRGLMVYLLDQFVLKLIIDPHTSSQTILRILGEEVSDNDVNGYGRGQKQKLLATGLQMVTGALQNRPQFAEIFAASQLKASPMGDEATNQKNETRERLEACLSKLIYNKIKPEEYRHPDEWFKTTRTALNNVPIAGTVATGLHIACRTPFYAISYCFREAGQSGDSFIGWMTKHLVASQTKANYIAVRLVDLIHHPSWRITALHLIEACISTLMVPRPQGQPIADEMFLITEFLLDHFKIPLPFDARKLSDLAAKGVHGSFFQSLFLETPQLEKLLGPLQPIIKELHLVLQVLDVARKQEAFDGDFTFWNAYVREVLNQQVASRISTAEPPTLSYIAHIRETLVDQYLQMDDRALWNALSQLPKYFEIKQWTDIIQTRPSLVDNSSGFCLLPIPEAPSAPGTEHVKASVKSIATGCGVLVSN